MTKWTFCNRSLRRPAVSVRSGDHAVELLWEHSGWPEHSEYGVILEFTHSECGMITCIASTEFLTLEFSPNFTSNTRSSSGRRMGIRIQPVREDPFYFVDDIRVTSSIPLRYVLPIIKVTRAVKHIVEHLDFPGGIRWSDPIPVEE